LVKILTLVLEVHLETIFPHQVGQRDRITSSQSTEWVVCMILHTCTLGINVCRIIFFMLKSNVFIQMIDHITLYHGNYYND